MDTAVRSVCAPINAPTPTAFCLTSSACISRSPTGPRSARNDLEPFRYAHLKFPGLTEATETADWKGAGEQAKILDAAIVGDADFLRSADWHGKESRALY